MKTIRETLAFDLGDMMIRIRELELANDEKERAIKEMAQRQKKADPQTDHGQNDDGPQR